MGKESVRHNGGTGDGSGGGLPGTRGTPTVGYVALDREDGQSVESAVATCLAAGDEARGPEEWLTNGPGRWWVLHTRARNEKRVASMLAEHHVRFYLPLVKVRHTYAKARVAFDVPLFPGYVFLCGDHDDCATARKTNRIASILPVENQGRLRAELLHIYRAVAGGAAAELFPSLRAGQRCRITRGALQGVEGVVVRSGGRCRMYLSVSTLGQSAMVEVDAALLEAIA